MNKKKGVENHYRSTCEISNEINSPLIPKDCMILPQIIKIGQVPLDIWEENKKLIPNIKLAPEGIQFVLWRGISYMFIYSLWTGIRKCGFMTRLGSQCLILEYCAMIMRRACFRYAFRLRLQLQLLLHGCVKQWRKWLSKPGIMEYINFSQLLIYKV